MYQNVINNLAHWYSDCAAASKPAETGLIPVWAAMGIYSYNIKILIKLWDNIGRLKLEVFHKDLYV